MKLIAKLLCVWLLAMAGLGIYMSEGVVHLARVRVRDRARMMAVEYAATTGSALEDDSKLVTQAKNAVKGDIWSIHVRSLYPETCNRGSKLSLQHNKEMFG